MTREVLPAAKALARSIYTHVPFKQPLFDAVKRVWVPPRWLHKRLRFSGVISLPVPEHGVLRLLHRGLPIENSLYWEGLSGWEPGSLGLWTQLASRSKHILDVGASTGIYALLAKKVAPSARVDAFEPLGESYRILVENAKLNGLNIGCHQVALSNRDGETQIYVRPGTTYDASLNPSFRGLDGQSSRRVKVRRGDSFLAESPGSRVDLIKVDTETHEAEVLEGLTETISVHRPTILVELIRGSVAERVQKLLADFEYTYYEVDEGAGHRLVHRPTPRTGVFNFLFVHDEQHAVLLR